jgi:hypothetical protein
VSILTSPEPSDGEAAALAAWTARNPAGWRKSILEANRPRPVARFDLHREWQGTDFAIVMRGDDLVGFIALVFDIPVRNAARPIAALLGIDWRLQ